MKRNVLLSTLWIVLVLEFLYCDVLGLHEPAYLAAIIDDNIGGIGSGPGFLVAAGALMQVPIAMVLLSRVLRRTASRVANVVAGVFMALVQASSLLVGTPPTPVYLMFSAIEIGLLLAVVILAIAWRRPQPDGV